jgi:ankyrin repeat protein
VARLHELLAAHADVNVPQADGSTALHWAAYQADPRTAAALLAAGANPNVRSDTGMTPLCQ